MRPRKKSETIASTAEIPTTTKMTMPKASCIRSPWSQVRARFGRGVHLRQVLTDQSIWTLERTQSGRFHAYGRAEGVARDGARFRAEGDPPRRLGVRPRRRLARGRPAQGVGGRADEPAH